MPSRKDWFSRKRATGKHVPEGQVRRPFSRCCDEIMRRETMAAALRVFSFWEGNGGRDRD
jgi:hypothetical protein